MRRILILIMVFCLLPINGLAKNKPDLKNIANFADFSFSAQQKQKLLQNQFVIVPDINSMEFFQIYEENRYAKIPNFITVDSVLHNYHLLFDYLLRDIEKKFLAQRLQNLSQNMLAASLQQYQTLQKTPWENAAKRNVAFFAVGAKLLDPNAVVPAIVAKAVQQELALIAAHHGIAPAIVMNLGLDLNKPLDMLQEDYSQYIPRGHYNADTKLQAYFKAMIWYGRMTFKVQDQETLRSAALITLALNEQPNAKLWASISEPINFFVGKSDDLGYHDLVELLEKVYGKQFDLDVITNSPAKFPTLVAVAQQTSPPAINSIPIYYAKLQPNRDAAVTGFRFLGQRFTIDAAVMQQLVVRAVGPKDVPCEDKPYAEGRMLPKALDFIAALGSKLAVSLLKNEGEYAYACYPQNMEKMQKYLAQLPEQNWKLSLYSQWIYALKPLLESKLWKKYPKFMTTNAWLQKDLLTFLGSYTELKHDTALYIKQVYAEMGDGSEEKDDRGYVEPEVNVYLRLTSLLDQTKAGMVRQGLLSAENKKNIELMQAMTNQLTTIATKELRNAKLTPKEFDFIRYFGGDLEHFWLECYRDVGIQSVSELDQKPAALVTDIATDPNGTVLQEAIGNVATIYVIVTIDGKPRIASGGVYTYYEFMRPMAERLTDESWRLMVRENKNMPIMPKWIDTISANAK